MLLDFNKCEKAFASKGFHFLKIELEAQIMYSKEVEEVCPSCAGSGRLRRPEDGRRRMDCCDCATRGYISHSGNYDVFQRLLLMRLPKEILEGKVFWYGYNDGSVNTEITFTIPISLLGFLPEVLKQFKNLASEFGGMRVDNAGMHLTLLETGEFYDDNDDDDCMQDLPRTKIHNFRIGMERVIDSMFLLASIDGVNTRPMRFRQSQVSYDDKYSAIYTHNDTCIEYRIFDTCYDTPERILLFLNTIVKTLKFYSNGAARTQLDYSMTKVPRGNGYNRLCDIYNSNASVKRLLEELIHLHPEPKKVEHIKKRYEAGMVSDKFVITNLAKV